MYSLNLLVIGGADGIGTWLAKRVFARTPDIARITLADIKPLMRQDQTGATNPGVAHAAELASLDKQFDAGVIDYPQADSNLFSDWMPVPTGSAPPESPLRLDEYGLVMISVPETVMDDVASAILPHLRQGAWVFDVSSTKEAPIDAMVRYVGPDVSVLGTHPLFGPAVPDIIGQTVVLVPTALTDGEFYNWLKGLIQSLGGLPEEIDPLSHDRYMLYVQTLAHFTYLVFGRALGVASRGDFDLSESFRFSTPPYGILSAFTARIVGGSPGLYAQIQSQPGSQSVRQLLVDAAKDLSEQFSKGQPEVLQAIGSIVAPYRGNEVARAYANSIVLADSVQQSFRELYNRKQTGALTIAEARDPLDLQAPSRLHVGLVTDVDGEGIEFLSSSTTAEGKWFVAYDAESERSLKRVGKNVRAVSTRISRHNIRRVLTIEETVEWRKANLKHHQRDIAVLVDDGIDVDYVCDVVTAINPAVVSGVVDEIANVKWLNRYGMANKLVRFTIFGDRDPELCVDQISKSLKFFGIRTMAA